MVMFRNQNAGEIRNSLTANTAFEYFLKATINQNCFQEDFKC